MGPKLNAFKKAAQWSFIEVGHFTKSNYGDVLARLNLLKMLPIVPAVGFNLLKRPSLLSP